MTIRFLTNPCDSTRITSEYGIRNGKFHSGIDIGAIKRGVSGDQLYAVDYGAVAETGYKGNTLGNYIVLAHSGYCTMYAHDSRIDVAQGTYVNAGRRIGLMGNTGYSTGPHLHFEVRLCNYSDFWKTKNGKPVYATNPKSYLRITESNTINRSQDEFTNHYSQFSDAEVKFPYSNLSVDYNSIKAYEKLYGRRYRIIVTDDFGTQYDLSDMHCVFEVTKSLLEKFNNRGYITIYNLEPETENQIILHGKNIIIEAGYEGSNYGEIFSGNIVQSIRSKENGVDYALEIISVDSEQFLTSSMTNVAINKGQTMRDAIIIASNKATIPMQINSVSEEYNQQKYTRGKVIFGKTQDYIQQMAKSKNALFFIDNGSVNIKKVSDVPSGEVIKIDYDSGMIGAPSQTEYGCEFKALLNPQITINNLVQINKQHIVERQYQMGAVRFNDIEQEGIYRVIEVEYSGDTRGNDWYCKAQTVVQSGAYPSILREENYSIY